MSVVRTFLNVFFAVLILLSSACVMAGAPTWIAGEPAEYPNEQYLIGRGVGATEAEAQNRARGDLATIFEVRVAVTTENRTTIAQSGKKAQVDKLATQQVSAKTDKVLSGVTVAKLWRDPQTQDFHALAVLSRDQAGAGLREELLKIDEEVRQRMAAAEISADPLLKVGALSQALAASVRRDGFQASLRVVDPSGRGIEAPVARASIQAGIDEVLKKIRITPEVAADAGRQEFSSLLKGGLAAAGFLASDQAAAELVLVGKLVLTDLGRQANWNWVRGTVEVALVEKASGRVRGSKTWPFKASAQDAETARSRALIEVERLFRQELRPAIISFAAS